MICYASNTGTARNLAALRAAGWGIMVSRGHRWADPWYRQSLDGFTHIAADNGAWRDFQAGEDFDEDGYERFLRWLEAQAIVPDWCVLPDIVAGGAASLALSTRYLNRCKAVSPLVLIPVQDGMEHADLAPLVGPGVGIFLGGSTEWKLARMADWGAFCARHRVHYHVARVNTMRRMFAAIAAGADSCDGSNASRYACNLPMLDSSSRHRDLFAPCRM